MDFFKVVTTEIATLPSVPEFDYLARVSRSTSSEITNISAIETQTFVTRLLQLQSEWRSDISAMNDVINWQHKLIDFNSSYSAYLLEQIDDDEFERIAEDMATEEREIPSEVIAPMITRLLNLTTVEFTSSDFANLFNCSIETIDKAIRLVPNFIKEAHPQLQEASE